MSKIGPAKKNQQIAWFASELGSCLSDAALIRRGCEVLKISPATAYRRLGEAYEHLASVNRAERPAQRDRLREVLWGVAAEAGEQMRCDWQVQALDKIARLGGLYEPDKLEVTTSPRSAAPAPGAELVRARLRQLAQDPELREKAIKLGLDVEAIRLVDSGE